MSDQQTIPRYHRAVDVYRGRCPRSTFYWMVAQGQIKLIRMGRRSFCAETWDEIIERLGVEKPRHEAPIARKRADPQPTA